MAETLAELESLETPALRERWEAAFGRPVPKRMKRDLLLRVLAWHLQERMEGGLRKATRKRLASTGEEHVDAARTRRASSPRCTPGTRLVREWRGEAHHVTVHEDGFEYRGARFRSLSRIARIITGTRWSGPAFFGLRQGNGRAKDVSGDG